jgi:hypothetical protein
MNAMPTSPSDPAGDRVTAASESASPASGPRRLFVIAVIAALLGFVITLSFGYADHAPRPHGVRLAVAAAPTLRAKLAAGLDRHEPGGFDLLSVPSAQAAIQGVRSQRTAGGLIVPPTGAVTIVTAAAEGLSQQQAITGALTAAAQSMRRSTKLVDVAPLPAGDSAGLSSFVFGLGLLLPSVIGGLGIFLLGMRLRVWWRVASATLFAVLVASGAVLALDTVLGALTGASAALIGVGFLGALSFALFVAALQAVVGLPGTGLAALTFIFIGNAVSGGSVPVSFLPAGFRQISPWLPNNAIVRAVRDVTYFHGHDLGHPLLVLGLWIAIALIALSIADLIHLSERRLQPHNANEIYRTSTLAHLKRRREARSLNES